MRDQRNVGVHKRVLDITATESLYTATRNDERRDNCSRNDSAQGIPSLRSPLHNHSFSTEHPPSSPHVWCDSNAAAEWHATALLGMQSCVVECRCAMQHALVEEMIRSER